VKLSAADLGFLFTGEHQILAGELAEAAPAIEQAGRAGAAEVAAEMGRRGLYGRLLTEKGHRVDLRALCLVREMLAYVSPLADAIFAVQGLGSYPIALDGSEEQRRLLPSFRRGESIGGFALTEPEAGSDVASMRAVARAEDGGFVLDGKKTFISNVGIATHYVVFANADPARGKKGISAFLVPAGTPGLVERPIAMNIDHPIGELDLAGVRVGEEALLGAVGGGLRLALRTLDTFRVTVGAAAVGMARRAFDEALAHVRARVQFGVPLSDQPVVQSQLADMATELDAARLLVLRAARVVDDGAERATSEAAMAKLYATEAAQRIIDRAVQLFGGRGVVSGEVVEGLYRAVRPLRIYEGTSEIQRLVIGRALARGDS
jgi:acyl-CoA dehydrogenase